MMVLFGVLGLLQAMFLPGLLVRKIGKLRGGILEQLICLLPLSLLVNYLLVFLLAALHVYNRPVLLVIMAAEVLGLCLLYRESLTRPLSETFRRITEAVRTELSPAADFLNGKTATLGGWIWLISGCFALSGVIWALHLCRLNYGTIFSGWDTLFSWNAYAETWAAGRVPEIGGMYPQLVPANWSLSYVLQGEGAVQFFNTLLPPLFFLMIQLMLFDLGFQRSESSFFIAAVIARFMMKKLMGDQLFDGYMDVPAAAMCLVSIYTLLRAEARPLPAQRQAVILSICFAAGAAVTKQSGFAALPAALTAAFLLMPEALRTLTKRQKICLICAAAVIVLPWYLHCLLFNTRGYERELIAEGIMDYNRRFNAQFRVESAVSALGKYGIFFILSLAGLPFVPKRYRLPFSLMVWPLTLIWAFFYSYDARNLGPVLPFVSLLCGMAIAGFGTFAAKAAAKCRAGRIPVMVLFLAAGCAAAVLLLRRYPDGTLTEDQRTRQKALFGERLNSELLYGYFGENHTGNDIYTDYPAWFLPGYEDCCSAAELTDSFQVKKVLEEDKINWMLLPVVMPNDTDPSKELIEQCIADGKCWQVGCSDGYYKAYCLYQIAR